MWMSDVHVGGHHIESRHVTDLLNVIVLWERKACVRGEGKMSARDKGGKRASTSPAKIVAVIWRVLGCNNWGKSPLCSAAGNHSLGWEARMWSFPITDVCALRSKEDIEAEVACNFHWGVAITSGINPSDLSAFVLHYICVDGWPCACVLTCEWIYIMCDFCLFKCSFLNLWKVTLWWWLFD